MTSITTTDLLQFGYREIELTAELLQKYLENTSILGDGVHIMFNKHSGYVFLTDEDYNVAMFNGEKLERFYTCGYCGHKGFKEAFEKHKNCINLLQCPNCEGENGEIYQSI